MKRLTNFTIFLSLILLLNACTTKPLCTNGDCQNGQGTFTFANGDKYVGELKNDEFHGQGTLIIPSLGTYVGNFGNGTMHRQGTFIWENGNKYVGEFYSNKVTGNGILYNANGDILRQQYKPKSNTPLMNNLGKSKSGVGIDDSFTDFYETFCGDLFTGDRCVDSYF